MFKERIKMVKFVISFLFSFKSFPENGVQYYSGPDDRGSDGERPIVRFKAHPERKNICNITFLLPGSKELIEKKISVACWQPMLKVYHKKEDYYFRTETYDNKIWAAFTLKQTLDDLKLEQFRGAFAKSLEFYFNEDQKSLQRFRNESFGIYLIPKAPKECHFGPVIHFKESYMSKINQKQRSNLTIQSARKKDTTKETTTANKSKLDHPKSKPSETLICRTIAAAHLHKIKKAMKTNEEYVCPRTPSNCSLFLPLSNLFYDKSVWVLRSDKPMSKNIQDIYVFVTVYSFLDEEARKIYNPFCINVQSLQYLPMKELQEKGINKVFVEYQLSPIIPITRTKLLYLKENSISSYKDIKVFITEKFSPLKIMSSLQSKKLYVKVIGIRDNVSRKKEHKPFVLYGGDMKDDRFSSCVKTPLTNEFTRARSPVKRKSVASRSTRRRSSAKSMKSKSKKKDDGQHHTVHSKDYLVLIGTARIDLSPLVFGNSSVIAYEELSSLPVMIHNPITADIEHLCITLIHEDLCKYEKGVLKNRSLCESNTMIKLTAKCAFLLKPECIYAHPTINEAYSRVITVLVDKDFSTEILQTIFSHNRESLDMKDYDLPLVPFRKMYKVEPPPPIKSILTFQKEPSPSFVETDSEDYTDNIIKQDYFTGFSIDCINQVLMYIEGPTVETFPSLLTELIKFNTSQGRILYSSDLLYETRIYDDFKRYGGMYCITMKSTIDDFIKKASSLCYGVSVPQPAWKALKQISKLSTCKTVLEAVQDCYLPRPEQLISFDVEFGLPHCIISKAPLRQPFHEEPARGKHTQSDLTTFAKLIYCLFTNVVPTVFGFILKYFFKAC